MLRLKGKDIPSWVTFVCPVGDSLDQDELVVVLHASGLDSRRPEALDRRNARTTGRHKKKKSVTACSGVQVITDF